MPKYSYIITEGFEKNKVLIDVLLKQKLLDVAQALDLGVVTSVSQLPETGKNGTLYYNTTDDKYYTYSDGAYSEFSPSGVTEVDGLPQEGEQGRIYYNTGDGKYYTYDGSTFTEVGKTAMPYREVSYPDNTLITDDFVNAFTVESNVYYHFKNLRTVGGFNSSGEGLDTPGTISGNKQTCTLQLNFTYKPDVAEQYIGRFTAPIKGVTVVLPAGVHFPDDVIDIEADHIYELNILRDVCLIADITYTDSFPSIPGMPIL